MAKGKYEKWLLPEGLTKIAGWARSGLNDEQICHNMGISTSTLYAWIKDHPQIAEALKKAKEVADYEVENALYRRATGFTYEEEVVEKDKYGVVTTKVIQKTMPPDPTSIIFWLKNRRPDIWRDLQKVDLAGGLKLDNPFEELSVEELRKLSK